MGVRRVRAPFVWLFPGLRWEEPNMKRRSIRTILANVLAVTALIASASRASAQDPNLVLTFSGTGGDDVSIASAPDLQNPTEFTVEAWISPQAGLQNNSLFINKSDDWSNNTSRSYEVHWVNNADSDGPGKTIRFIVFFDVDKWTALYAPAPEGKWIHVAGTFSSTEGSMKLYTNGVLAKATNSIAGVSMVGMHLRQTTLPVRLGRGDPSPLGSQFFAHGFMDEVRIWSKARSVTDIAGNLSCRLAGNETGLAGYWNFDDGSARDLTGHGHNGTLSSGGSILPEANGNVVHAGCPCIPHRATATASVVNGFVVGATVTDAGCGYTNSPAVLIIGSGTGATATATISGGLVTGINIVNAGSGYTGVTQIRIASPPFTPWLELAVTKVNVTLHLVLGRKYQLQSSTDLQNWAQVGQAFTAQDELITQEFAVDTTGRYFKIQEVP